MVRVAEQEQNFPVCCGVPDGGWGQFPLPHKTRAPPRGDRHAGKALAADRPLTMSERQWYVPAIRQVTLFLLVLSRGR